jgi:hypothetical protein
MWKFTPLKGGQKAPDFHVEIHSPQGGTKALAMSPKFPEEDLPREGGFEAGQNSSSSPFEKA